MLVRLTPDEIRVACHHAADRYANALARGAKPKVNVDQPEDRAATDFLSSMAEMAVSKGLNLYWSGVGGVGVTDVGNQYEVRSTPLPHGKLVISEGDKDGQEIVLVTCNPPEFNIVGCIYAREGKKNAYRFTNARGWCWMVPQEKLRRFKADQIKQPSSVGENTWLLDL